MTNVRWGAKRRRQWRWGRRLSRGGSPRSCAECSSECSSVVRSREATAPAEGSARVSASSSAQIPPAQRLPVTSQRSCTTVCHHHHSTLGGTCRESLRRSPPARRHPLLAAISATIQCMRLASFMPQARVALGCAPTHTRERHFEYPIEPGTLGTLERWRRRRQQRRQRLRQGEQLGSNPVCLCRVYNCAYSPLRVRIFGSQVRRGARPPEDSGAIGTIGTIRTSNVVCQKRLAQHDHAREAEKILLASLSCIFSCQSRSCFFVASALCTEWSKVSKLPILLQQLPYIFPGQGRRPRGTRRLHV